MIQRFLKPVIYRILSNRTARRLGNGMGQLQQGKAQESTKMAVSQSQMVQFSFCKKDFKVKMSSITCEYSWGWFYWKGSSVRENIVVLLLK